MTVHDTFTDAQGRHYIAGKEVPPEVWARFEEIQPRPTLEWHPYYMALVGKLDELRRKAKDAHRGIEAGTLLAARDAIEMLALVLWEVRGHHFDTQHLVEAYAKQGKTFRPRLADKNLYHWAGLPPIEEAALSGGSPAPGGQP